MPIVVSSDSLGLWCPEGGSFWICKNKPSRFIGCCRFNPCETVSGVCADDNLTPSSFDGRAVHRVAEQDCVRSNDSDSDSENGTDTASWYACAETKPPFIGCCASDACSQGGCDAMSLRAGRLGDDRDAAASLLVSAASNVSGRVSTSVRAATAVTALSSPVASETGGLGLTHDGLVGLAGALIALLAVAALTVAALLWRLLRRPTNPNSLSYVYGSDSAALPSRDFDSGRTAVVAGFTTDLGPSTAMRSGPGTTPAPRSPRLGNSLAVPSSSEPTWTLATCSPARVGQPAWDSPPSTAAGRAPTPAPAPTLPGGQINLERLRSRSRILSGMETHTTGSGEHVAAFEDEWGRPERLERFGHFWRAGFIPISR